MFDIPEFLHIILSSRYIFCVANSLLPSGGIRLSFVLFVCALYITASSAEVYIALTERMNGK
jgi:hypothetical protein